MKKRVVITGTSVISPLGEDLQTILSALRAKKNAVIHMDEWAQNPKLKSHLCAPAQFTMPNYPRKTLRSMGRVALLGVTAADRAVQEAGLSENPILSNGQTGVAFGVSSGSHKAVGELLSVTMDGPNLMNATTYVRYMPQTVAVNISLFFSTKGRLITTDVACASSNLAIGSAYEFIAAGKQTVMLAGGGDELSLYSSAVFDTLFATSLKNDTPKLTPAPFDKDRDGLVTGEAAGIFVLEEYEFAKARGANIWGEVVGFGQTTDGYHITQPSREMMSEAMRMSIADAEIHKEQIGYINAHGTATKAGDIEESFATNAVFGKNIPISTQKSYVGHTLAGCGVLESYFSLHMMRENWFAPNLNLNNIDPNVAELQYITGNGLNLETEYVMCNNFAFGGVNTSLIIKRFN